MASVNKVFLLGNLTRDPEISQLPSGTVVCDFTLATNRQYKTSSGEEREETLFCDCAAFGRVGEIIGEYCAKGRQLFVEGRLHYESWEDAKTNAKRSKLSVIVESFQFLGPRDDAKPTNALPKGNQAKPWRRANDPADAGKAKAPAGKKPARKNVDQAAEDQDNFQAAELPF